MICDRCYQPADVGEHGLYRCPLEPRRATPAIWGDEIPGGLEIANGLCHPDGTPRRYYSKSEIALECAKRGLVPYHEVFAEGGNKRLEDARHRDDYLKTSEAARAKRHRDEARQEKYLKRDREAARHARG